MPFKTNYLGRLMPLLSLLFICSGLFAQTEVTGRIVSNTDKQPILGVTVQVRGSRTAVQSDADGRFSIKIPSANSTLVITAVGFNKLELPVSGRASLGDISLTTTSSALNENVVTGYSAQKKKDITGSVAIVNVKDMKAIVSGSPEQMLQGQAAGVTI